MSFPSPGPNAIQVAVVSNAVVASKRIDDMSPEEEELSFLLSPVEFQVGDHMYFVGESEVFGSGDRLLYGSYGIVQGRTKGSPQQIRLSMMFPGNTKTISCEIESLSKFLPRPLPRRLTAGQQVYYGGPPKFTGRAFLSFGMSGEVRGPAPDSPDSVVVYFVTASGSESTSVPAALLSLRPLAPLPEGFEVGDGVYFTGPDHTFDSGINVKHGAFGEVQGHAVSPKVQGEGLSVLFSESTDPVDCCVTQLARLPPAPLPMGEYQVGADVYFIGDEHTTECWMTVRYGDQGTVTAGAATSSASQAALTVRFGTNVKALECPKELLSCTVPAPLPGGFQVGQQARYVGPETAFDVGHLLSSGVVGIVVGPSRTPEVSGQGVRLRFPGLEHVVEVATYHLTRRMQEQI